MSSPSDLFVIALADAFALALDKLLDTPEGEDKFCAYLERLAANQTAHEAAQRPAANPASDATRRTAKGFHR